jgi:hypothetical protein
MEWQLWTTSSWGLEFLLPVLGALLAGFGFGLSLGLVLTDF